ncbi:MAG: PocR ligand-binding domain-containing protein [Caldilineaceae bacterium]
MLHPDRWPFTPKRISDIIESTTLSVIIAGCCERIGRSLTLLDASNIDEQRPQRMDTINRRQNFSKFCEYLRNPEHFDGGNEACEQCDLAIARAALRTKSAPVYDSYHCHMGLYESRVILKVRGQPVGVLLCGQWQAQDGAQTVQAQVHSLEEGRSTKIKPRHAQAISQLLELSKELKSEETTFGERLRKEVLLIEKIAETSHRHKKIELEEEFLNQLRSIRSLDNSRDLHQISERLATFLQKIQEYCRSKYVVFFANQQPDETVLIPVAQIGVPEAIAANLPHFNWRKAGLALNSSNQTTHTLLSDPTMLGRGLRGGTQGYFLEGSSAVAISLGQAYRAVMLFGPFAEKIRLEEELGFLSHMARIISWSVHTEIQMLRLRDQKKEQENLAALITHQVRTALTPISTHIGTAKILTQAPPSESALRLIRNALKAAHDLSMRLGTSVTETLRSAVLLQERDDMTFEPYPLSVLVANCAQGFVNDAAQRQRQLIIHDSIEYLPTAEVDIARLTIALSNLLNNAIKYSYPNTRIVVRAAIHGDTSLDLNNAEIEIQNDGDEIPEDKRERIFLQGVRGLTGAKLERIPGTGLGLWEARAVIENHGGKIDVKCDRTSIYYRQLQAFRVVFTVTIPLTQK